MLVKFSFVPNKNEETVELEESATGKDLLFHLNLAPDAHILIRDKTPVPVDDRLIEGDIIGIISVVSGG